MVKSKLTWLMILILMKVNKYDMQNKWMNDVKNFRLGGKTVGFSVLDEAPPEEVFVYHILWVWEKVWQGQCSVFVSVT